MTMQLNRTAAGSNTAAASTSLRSGAERRRTLRIATPFPIVLRGIDRTGERFVAATILDNLSATGLYLRLMRPVVIGTPVFVVVRLTPAPAQSTARPGVAIQGVVLRTEPRPGGAWGMAVAFMRHRFLYADTSLSLHPSTSREEERPGESEEV
jgi:hypothetical protein